MGNSFASLHFNTSLEKQQFGKLSRIVAIVFGIV